MDFSFFSTLYETLTSSSYGRTVLVGAQLFAGALFFVGMIKKYVKGLGVEDSNTMGLTKRDLFESLGYLLLIVFSSSIVGLFESFLIFFESQFTETIPSIQELTLAGTQPLSEQESDGMAYIIELIVGVVSNLTTVFLIPFITLIKILIWCIDLIIYPLFLAERFFLLGFMQVLFPLAIAVGILDEFRGITIKFFKFYMAVYLLVPGLFLVNVFLNNVAAQFNINVIEYFLDFSIPSTVATRLIEPIILTFLLLLKIKLYKRMSSFIFQLFS